MIELTNARVLAGVFILLLSACATPPQTAALRSGWPAQLPEHVELERVPFHAQEEHQCGPAALATVLQDAGRNVVPEQLTEQLYLPERQGSLQVEMAASARRYDTVAYPLQPVLGDVLAEVSAGNPVLVLQNLGLSWYPVWHYAVVIGYDRVEGNVILRSGLEQRQLMPFPTFEYTWARSGHWALVVLPPGKIPHTASADAYVRSVVELEHTRPEADTAPAYAAALQRWPDALLVQLTAANAAYRHGQLPQAAQLLQRAARQHPDSVAALNNLAQVLSELGQLQPALAAARQAVALGGSLNAQARATQVEIEEKINHTGNRP